MVLWKGHERKKIQNRFAILIFFSRKTRLEYPRDTPGVPRGHPGVPRGAPGYTGVTPGVPPGYPGGFPNGLSAKKKIKNAERF